MENNLLGKVGGGIPNLGLTKRGGCRVTELIPNSLPIIPHFPPFTFSPSSSPFNSPIINKCVFQLDANQDSNTMTVI